MAKLIDQHRAFIEALYENAVQGKISWKVSNSGTIDATIGRSIVELSEEVDHNDQPSIRIQIKNMVGEVIDSFDDNYFTNFKPSHVPFDNYWQLLSELYTTANRSARGADQVLSELLLKLEAKAVVDPPAPSFGSLNDLDDDVPF